MRELWGIFGAICTLAGCGGLVERDPLGGSGVGGSGGLTKGGAGGGVALGGSGGAIAGGSGGVGNGGNGGNGGSAGTPCVDIEKNPDHCGACGHSCLGGDCMNGVCQLVVVKYLGQDGATALALDADHVYWASPIQRAQKNGSAWTTLGQGGYSVWGVAVDETSVYWSDVDKGVFRTPKSGGDPVNIGPSGYRVAIDATHVYAAWQGVYKIAKSDGALTKLASTGGQGIALDDEFVYFTTWSPGGVFRVGKNGGKAEQLAPAQYSSYVAVFGDMVYWSVQAGGGVMAVPKNGGPAKQLAELYTPYGIAADARGVYWADFDGGKIWMLPTGATTPLELASGQHNPRDLAIDEKAVYWTNDSIYSAISLVAKPVPP